jgi:hypothetical protein
VSDVGVADVNTLLGAILQHAAEDAIRAARGGDVPSELPERANVA